MIPKLEISRLKRRIDRQKTYIHELKQEASSLRTHNYGIRCENITLREEIHRVGDDHRAEAALTMQARKDAANLRDRVAELDRAYESSHSARMHLESALGYTVYSNRRLEDRVSELVRQLDHYVLGGDGTDGPMVEPVIVEGSVQDLLGLTDAEADLIEERLERGKGSQ